MQIKIIMMFKNEDDLLRPWVRYHKELVGPENLIIFDNGSTSPRTQELIAEIRERDGVEIIGDFSSPEDFVTRGDLYRKTIQRLDQNNPADFYFPLDCDEFLAVLDQDGISMQREAIINELRNFVSCEAPLLIGSGLDNNPSNPGWFKWAPNQRKTFFAQNTCKWLDHGFHSGATKNGAAGVKTRMVYVHFHYKPYPIFIEHSKAKLMPFLDEFSESTLRKYLDERKSAFHCARYMLMSMSDYYSIFEGSSYIQIPAVELALRNVGEGLPFNSKPKSL